MGWGGWGLITKTFGRGLNIPVAKRCQWKTVFGIDYEAIISSI